jgi:hypothetical protein
MGSPAFATQRVNSPPSVFARTRTGWSGAPCVGSSGRLASRFNAMPPPSHPRAKSRTQPLAGNRGGPTHVIVLQELEKLRDLLPAAAADVVAAPAGRT